MPLPAWPSECNSWALLGSWQVAQMDNAPLTSDMNAGTTRSRRKYTMRITPMSFTLVFPDSELSAFKTFHAETLSAGSARFTMPVWDGTAYVERTVKFKSPPKMSEFAFGRTLVTIDLLVESL